MRIVYSHPKSVTAPIPWYRTITREQWLALAAAKLGWMLDAMDFMLYVVALNQLRSYFGFNDATAGLLATVALVMSGVGGLTFGYVADRFGRTRALMGTIALFSIASLGAASGTDAARSVADSGCTPICAGRSTRTVVPRPTTDWIEIAPSAWWTIPYAVARPSPVPLPFGLVVKNGSKARAITSLDMP